MTADEARTLIDYYGWASGKVLEAVHKLSAEDRERANGTSHMSITGTASHIYLAERLWFGRVHGTSAPTIGHATFAEAEIEWPALQAQWKAWAAALTDADMERVIEYKLLSGAQGANQIKQIVTHLVNHATLHRGQIVGMIRQLGIQPPATDILWYYRDNSVQI